MTTITTSVATAYSIAKQQLYNTEVDQFNKTTFASPGQGVAVTFDTIGTPVGIDASIATDGSITLTGNITYAINFFATVTPGPSDSDVSFQPGWVLFDTNAGLVFPTFPLGVGNTTYYTPPDNTVCTIIAFMPDGTPPNTTTQPNTWQYPQQLQNARISVQAVSGFTV